MPTATTLNRQTRATAVPVLTAGLGAAVVAEVVRLLAIGRFAIDGTFPPSHGQI